MRAFFILFFISALNISYCQNLDSLKNVVTNTQEAEKYEVIRGYMRSFIKTDVQAAYTVSNYALEYAESKGDSILIAKALYAQGFLLRRLEEENRAVQVLKRGYGIAKRNQYLQELANILNLLAVSYTYTANYDAALKANFEALTVNEKLNSPEDVSISYNNIGLVYYKLLNEEEALKYYKKSLQIKKSIGSSFDLDRLYVNMALCYNQMKEYEEAENSINLALSICKEECIDEVLMDAECGLGISLLERGRDQDSKVHFDRSLQIARKSENKRFIIENLSRLARVYNAEKRTDQALAMLSEAERIAKSADYQQPLMEIYKRFADIYAEIDDYKSSALYRRKYSNLRDSVISEELIKNLATIQANYAERENLSTIADNERVIRAQRYLNFAIAFIGLMAFAFIYLIMRNTRMVRRLNSKLALEVEKKTKELVRANHYLKQVNDELDNLVYKTSHDIRGPLATLKGVCNVALMDVKDRDALSFLQKLDITASQLNQVLDKFSRVNEIYNTHVVPRPISIADTVEEIVLLQKKVERLKPIEVIIEIEALPEFETEPRLFYYILNSLIDNAFRYYNESKRLTSFVRISAERKGEDVVIRVVDNGVGIPINIDSDSLFHMFTRGSERSLTGGMGLFIATIATRKLQGEIEFQRSADFLITEFVLTLPVRMDANRIEKPRERGPQAPSQRIQVDYKDYTATIQ